MSEEWRPLIMLAIPGSDSFVGNAEVFENDMEPFPEQLQFGEGDCAMIAMSAVPLEQDFVVCKGVNPSEYAASFPDWQARLDRHALCELFSRTDPELSIGWVARLKLMPIPNERYEEVLGWPGEGWPEELPDWTEVIYKAFSHKLFEVRPDIAPLVVECPLCHSEQVAVIVERTISYKARAGVVEIEGVRKHVPITEVSEKSEHKAYLQCTDCEAKGILEDGEWQLPGITN